MGKTINNLDKSLENSLKLSGYSRTDHTHNYLPLSGGTMTGTITTPNNAQGIKIGDDVTICDRNVANFMVLEGSIASSGGIIFGSGKDTNIYRGGANLLKTDDTFNAVSGFQWNGESLDTRYAKASHGTHLTIGTGASNAAAGNHTHTNIVNQDTRAVNTTPDGAPIGLSVHLKSNGTDGLSDGGTYHSSLFIKGWNDYSGGPYGNIAISANNNLWFRSSSSGTAWNAWKKVSLDGHTHSYAAASSVGTLSSLKTSAKGNLVEAINELFQNANNGKQLIATAIGSPLSSSDTFSAMSTKITTMNTNLKNFLVKCGAKIESGKEGLNDLISLLISDSIMVKFPISFSLNSLPISCGQYHAAILKNNGTIATTGYNYSGQLGIGNYTNKSTFTASSNSGSNIIQVVCGGSHTVVLKKDGSVMVTGENSSGQLGINTQNDITSFTGMLNVNNDIIKVACGTNHTLVLKSDGTLWGVGSNSSGQLGIATYENVKILAKSNLSNVVDIIANGNHSFAIDKTGDVWCTGLNGNGQLGMGNYTSYNSFVKVNGLSNVKQIACGGNHTLVLKNDGTVWATGYNYYGQLGLGTSGSNANTNSFTKVPIDSVSYIACGAHHSVLVKTDGTLWACGNGAEGQLGLGNANAKAIFTQVTASVSNAQYVFCGGNFTYYMRKDGSVWSCGGNDKGQLGVGTTSSSFTFVGLSSSLLG